MNQLGQEDVYTGLLIMLAVSSICSNSYIQAFIIGGNTDRWAWFRRGSVMPQKDQFCIIGSILYQLESHHLVAVAVCFLTR